MTDNELERTVIKLANARADFDRIASRVLALQSKIAATHLGQELAVAQYLNKATAQDVIELELALREAALASFDGEDKHPHPAVTVKEYTVLKYDDREALEHARFHLPQAVKLDKREFDKIAKVTAFDFVTRLKEHRATIARDLSEWVTPTATHEGEE